MIMVGVQLVHHLRQQFGVAVVRARVRFVHRRCGDCGEATLVVGVCCGGGGGIEREVLGAVCWFRSLARTRFGIYRVRQ